MDRVHLFHADKHKFLEDAIIIFFMEVANPVQGTQNRKLVVFLQYVETNMRQLLLCFIGMQIIQIFYEGPIMFFVTSYVISFRLEIATQFKKIEELCIIIFTIDVHILTKKSYIVSEVFCVKSLM